MRCKLSDASSCSLKLSKNWAFLRRTFLYSFSFLVLLRGDICHARDSIDEALQARAQGLPQVTIAKLANLLANPSLDSFQKVRILRELGQTYFEAGRLVDALHILRNPALSFDAAARFWLAQSFAAQGEFSEALPLYKEGLTDAHLRPYAALGRVRMLRALGKYTEALGALENIPPDSPVASRAILEHVNILLDINRIKAAEAILKLNPQTASSSWGRYLAARVAMLEKRWSLATALLVDIQPTDNELIQDVLLARAECLIRTGDLSSAENILSKFIQEYPQHFALPIVFAKLDEIYARENSPSGGDLRRWAENADSPFRAGYAWFYYARNNLRINSTDSAISLFRKFICDMPFHPLVNTARTEVAQQYLRTHRPQEALDVLSKFQSHSPGATEIAENVDFLRGSALFALSRYAEAADAFLSAAHQDPSPRRETALYNAALSYLLSNHHSVITHPAQQELMRCYPQGSAVRELRLVEALQKAKQRTPDAGEVLDAIADVSPRARLALAELRFAANDLKGASDQWLQLNHTSETRADRAAYLAIFLVDHGTEDGDERVIRLARDFLDAYPHSPFKPEVRMKLGEVFFRRGNYLGARIQFESFAHEFPDSPMAETALFFAGQSSVRTMDASAIEDAMLIFEEVAKMEGPLALRARLEQARLQETVGHPDQALLILENILASKSDDDIRFEALMMQGNIRFGQGLVASENYAHAIKSWQQISSAPAVTLPWKNQALTKIGAAYQKLGDTDHALASYYGVFSAPHPADPEFFWFYKAGFDAAKLLESKQLWSEAINVYKQLAAIPGPRSKEARDRMERLKLANFILDK